MYSYIAVRGKDEYTIVPVYVCDDEKKAGRHIAQLIEKQILISNYDMGPIYTANSSLELLKNHQKDKVPAIYFFDVDLKDDYDGFRLATEIRKRDPRGYIIFITGHAELSFETFRYRLEAMDYIVKGNEDILVSRLQDCLYSIQQRLQDEQTDKSEYYTIKIFDTIRHIPIQEILYFEADGKQHRICLHMENENIEFFGSLQAVENKLGDAFFRTHRGFLVNRKRVACIDLKESTVQLDNGETCLLSRSARRTIQQIDRLR